MNYENEKTCSCGPMGAMPVEDLTDMLHETRSMAQEAARLVGKIGEHLFGNKKEAVCCSEEKRAEPGNFKEELSDVRRSVRDAIEELTKLCTMIGV